MIETASWARRFLALFIDWIASSLVVLLIWGPNALDPDAISSFYVYGVFIAQSAILTATVGGSFGKLTTRLRTVRWDAPGRPVGLIPAILRQAMICLVIPPLVFKPDGRGLHDLFAHSATVRLQDLRTAAG